MWCRHNGPLDGTDIPRTTNTGEPSPRSVVIRREVEEAHKRLITSQEVRPDWAVAVDFSSVIQDCIDLKPAKQRWDPASGRHRGRFRRVPLGREDGQRSVDHRYDRTSPNTELLTRTCSPE
jgi:hypothetical protein